MKLKKKIRFIINPRSGTNNKKNIHKYIHRNLDKSKYKHEIINTNSPNHATYLSKDAVKLGYDTVIAVGGDGTVNETAEGLIGSNTALGIIPTGSGNGLARHLKIPLNFAKAINVINQSQHSLIDTLKINDRISLGISGIGFDAHIAWRFSKSKKRGFWSYVGLVSRDYFKYKPKTFELEIDGNRVIKEALFLSFANSSQYGNDIKIAAHAQLDDGYLQVAILKNPPLYTIPLVLLMLKNGNINKSKYYETFTCKKVLVKQNNLMAHIDGEPNIFENGMNIKINSKSLKILSP